MHRVRTAVSSVLLAALAAAAQAQSRQEIPRFEGSRNVASSAAVEGVFEADRGADAALSGQQFFGQGLSRALVGAAALEAAREEGRRFVETRHENAAEADADPDTPPDAGNEVAPEVEDLPETVETPTIRYWSSYRADRDADG